MILIEEIVSLGYSALWPFGNFFSHTFLYCLHLATTISLSLGLFYKPPSLPWLTSPPLEGLGAVSHGMGSSMRLRRNHKKF